MRYDWCHCGAVIHVGTVTCATCTVVRRYVESEDTEFDVCDACEDWTPVREAVR